MSRNDDLDLLEMQLRWGEDASDHSALHWLGIGVGLDGYRIVVQGPDDFVSAVELQVASAPPSADPTRRPPSIEACLSILKSVTPLVEGKAGPRYVFPERLAPTVPADLVRPGDPRASTLGELRPQSREPEDWDSLVRGERGPWAVALATGGGPVVAIASTPRRLLVDAAEVGVWTDPAFRGRGLGSAVVAAWAELARSPGRTLFYATDALNYSSQRVADRLGLRLTGWVWGLSARTDIADAIRAAVPDADTAAWLLRFTAEALSWPSVQAGLRLVRSETGAAVPMIFLHHIIPGPVSARVVPAASRVSVIRGRSGDVSHLAVGDVPYEDVVATARDAYELAASQP